MNKPIIFNPEIRLSEHFRLGEFTKSITAERLRIVNEPGYEQILALRTRISCIYHPGTADLRTYQLYSSANSF